MNNTGVCGLFVIMYYLISAAALYFTVALGDSFNLRLNTSIFRAFSGCFSSFVSGILIIAVYFLSGRFKSFCKTCFKRPGLSFSLKLIPISIAVWLCGTFLNMVINRCAYNFFDITPVSQLANSSSAKVYVLNFLYVCIIAPVTEEMFFRGALVDSAKDYGAQFSVVISSLMFALAHSSVTVLGLPLVMGIVSAIVLIKTGCIFYCIMIHTLCNGMSFIVSVLPQSEKLYFAENMLILVCGSIITVCMVIRRRKNIAQFFKTVFLQSGKYFSHSSEIISLAAIVLYYIYSNYSLHFIG